MDQSKKRMVTTLIVVLVVGVSFGSYQYIKQSKYNMENSIQLANNLKEEQLYNDGLNLLRDGYYLEAIEQFEKVGVDNVDFYEDAQEKITQCREE